jgi:chromosome partitioning protein
MRVLSFVNQKGGCGKTTAAVNLAGAMVERGLRVLLIDLDPQAHATMALGCPLDEGLSTHHVLTERASLAQAWREAGGGVWLVPASPELGEFEAIAERSLGPEARLAHALWAAEERFDCVLLDCPPRADGVLTGNALRASTSAILVVETGAFSLQGALRAMAILEDARLRPPQAFDVHVLATLFDRRRRIAREVLVALQARFGHVMFDTVVRDHARLRECAALGAPVHAIDPGSRAAEDFHSLAQEILVSEPARALG